MGGYHEVMLKKIHVGPVLGFLDPMLTFYLDSSHIGIAHCWMQTGSTSKVLSSSKKVDG